MIQMQTRLAVADNTGAKELMCFTRLAHKMPVRVRFLRRRPV